MNAVRTYYGVHIHPVTRPTCWGARWEAFVPGRGFIMADTLAGIREGIREAIRSEGGDFR